MFNFFRINDPYRLLVIFVLLLIFRIPAFISAPLTIPELGYMLVGEKVTQGASLYAEVWDSIAPLSALVFTLLDYLFGRSQLAYQLVAYVLVCYQVFIFNRLLLESRAYNENTYVPGLIYGILISLSPDMVTLTPFLIGITFILLALRNIFSHIEVRAKRDEDILNIGLYLGLAAISYLSFALFALCTLLIFIFFTGTIGRRYLLMTFGFLLPLVIAGGYFFLSGRFGDFLYNYLSPFFVIERTWFISGKDSLRLFLVPLAYFVISMVRLVRGTRLTNYQARLNQAMFVWMVFSILFVVFSDQNSPIVYLILAPSFAFFISHYFLTKKRGVFTELSFILFTGLCSVTYIFNLYNSPLDQYYDDTAYLVDQKAVAIENKKILVLEDNLNPYYNNYSATPFLNWQLSKAVFLNLDYYDNLTIIYKGITTDKPEIILDPDKLMNGVFERIPQLRKMYVRRSDGSYYLRKKSVSS